LRESRGEEWSYGGDPLVSIQGIKWEPFLGAPAASQIASC